MRMGLLVMVLTTKIINNGLDMETEERICLIIERTSSFCRWITLRHNVHCLSSTTISQAVPDMLSDASPGTWHSLRKPRNWNHKNRHFQVSNFGLKCLYFAFVLLQACTLILIWFLFLMLSFFFLFVQ